MIRVEKLGGNEVFILETDKTSYVFMADKGGSLVQLYYGARLGLCDCGEAHVEADAVRRAVLAMTPKYVNPNGCSIIMDKDEPNKCIDDLRLEMSSRGKGDMREPFVELLYDDGSRTSDFRYKGYRLSEEREIPCGLPSAYDDADVDGKFSLVVELADKNSGAVMELVYNVYRECDCITRFARVINNDSSVIIVKRLMSAQLDLDMGAAKVVSFHGDWAREMNKSELVLDGGKYVSDSSTGFSSNKANPFIMLCGLETGEESGECYAANLIYSGNHRECVEIGSHCKTRLLTGINPDFFEWRLEAGESFCSPEAVLTHSDTGYQGISENMHGFVRNHIVRGKWKKKERPILINSWEAMYFDISERKLLQLAKAAAGVGIELFVLDDGWFGKRDSDATSLGDWYDNKEKLPNGIKGLSEKIRKLGLRFGIWVEPEMVSEDSDLYREHPDWAVTIPEKAHALGRNQMLLDLSRSEVQDYIIESMSDVFRRGGVSYVKWDMNRHMSDYYGRALSAARQGEFAHRYILGLYRVLGELTERFPNILFEACASGGNRFDLGMLCFMPQVWASDNTDALCRANIQNGYSYGYPQSVMGAHVSGCPNHQTLRITPLETRFNIASAGILGYECNLCDMPSDELAQIKEQIRLYKKWRGVLQFGQLYRLECGGGKGSYYDTDAVRWEILSADRKKAVGIMLQRLVVPNFSHRSFKTKGLIDDREYHFYNRKLKYDIHRMGDLINTSVPVHIKQNSVTHNIISKFVKLDGEIEDFSLLGSILNKSGVQLCQSYAGTGFNAQTAIYQDFDSRFYMIEAAVEN